MIKKISCLVSVFVIATALIFSSSSVLAEDSAEEITLKDGDSGDYVILVQLRLRDLGYFNYKITNYFGAYTRLTLAEFQENNNLGADGVLGPKTAEVLFSNAAIRRPIEERKKPEPKVNTPSVPIGKLKDWFSYVYPNFDRGEKIKVYDVDTGITYYMVRVGGSNHADVEPVSKADTAKFFETYDGEWSWERRAVVVRLDGEYIAASTNGFPHAYDIVSGNNMNGHVCIHFLNSKTHIRDTKDPLHQAMVQKAAGK